MIVYYNGDYLPKSSVSVSPDDRGFIFGDGVYEVVRSYNNRLFEIDAHIKRLSRSLRELRIKFDPVQEFKSVAASLISKNNLQNKDATIYIQITRGAAKRAHAFPSDDVPPTVYACASEFTASPEKQKKGVSVILTPDIRWTRCDIKSISLLPNVLGNQMAKENNAGETVFVRDNTITEGTHTNVFAVINNEVFTHPKNNFILGGITRDVVIDCCASCGIKINEESITEKNFFSADEIFLSGTTADITPVIQVNDTPIGKGIPGSVTMLLQDEFARRIEILK